METRPGAIPNDPSTWGPECARGIRYKDQGPVADGQKDAVRKISTGRKHRGMSSDYVEAKKQALAKARGE